MIAAVTSTPLPVVWSMTIGQCVRYTRAMPSILSSVNPLVAAMLSKDEEPMTDPEAIRATLRGLNVKGA
jgi:hypothetical protein